MDKKIIEKLQKLLALAASDNEHEAGLAMSKAESLMREHNLSVADVALNGSGACVESEEVPGLTKAVQKWEVHLGVNIALAFNGRVIRSISNSGWKFTFVAGRTDLVIIVDLYERLRNTVKRMGKEYVRREYTSYMGVSRETFHRSYRLGMVRTIRERLIQLKQNTIPDDKTRNVYGLTGKELMVVKDKVVDERVRQLFSHLKPSRSRSSQVITSAYQQGQADGQNISLHQSVGGSTGPRAISY
jgi:hypothetical protein